MNRMTRRDVLRAATGVAMASSAPLAALAKGLQPDMPIPPAVIPVRQGGFGYLPESGAPFSAAVVASEGFAFKRVRLRHPVPMELGFAWMARAIKAEGRPLASLAGCELRIPRRLTRPEFAEFNKTYLSSLRSNGFTVEESVAIARSNTAPAQAPPTSTVLSAYTFAVPRKAGRMAAGPDFVVSGSPENASNPNRVIAAGDVSPQGMQEKAAFVLQKLRGYVADAGANWGDITGCQVYTVQPLEPVMPMLQAAGLADVGITVFPAYIPVIGFGGANYEFEVDVRSVSLEQSLSASM